MSVGCVIHSTLDLIQLDGNYKLFSHAIKDAKDSHNPNISQKTKDMKTIMTKMVALKSFAQINKEVHHSNLSNTCPSATKRTVRPPCLELFCFLAFIGFL